MRTESGRRFRQKGNGGTASMGIRTIEGAEKKKSVSKRDGFPREKKTQTNVGGRI